MSKLPTFKMTSFSRKIASSFAGILFIFTSLVIPTQAQVFPGNPGANIDPGTYGSYQYSFCYYNNNADLECFESDNPQLGIVKTITDPDKFSIPESDGGTTIPYSLRITNNSNPSRSLDVFYVRDFLPDSVVSIDNVNASRGSLNLSNGNTDMIWNAGGNSLAPGDSVEITFDGTLENDLTQFLNQFQTNVACVSDTPITENNQNVLCNEVTFAIERDGNEVDLLINKNIVGDNSFAPGDNVQYEFTITNVGGQPVSDFNINENTAVDNRSVWPSDLLNNISSVNVSSGGGSASVDTGNNTISWSGTLDTGNSVVITADSSVRDNVPVSPGQNIAATNRACVENADDTNPTNDCATFNLIIRIPPVENPVLGIEKQIVDNDDRTIQTSEGGQVIEYRISVTNTSSTAQQIDEFFIIDSIPASIDSISNVDANIGTATQIGNSPDIRWNANGATFGQQDQVEITFNATLVDSNTLEDLLLNGDVNQVNIACTRLTENGANLGCDTDQFTLIPVNVPDELDLALFKGEENGSTGFFEGETISYEFIVTNNSNASVDNFTINEDAWPTQLVNDISSVSTDSGSVSNTGNNITWNAANGTNPLNSFGGSVTIIANATVRSGLNLTETTPAPNTACVETDQVDVNPANDCQDFSVNIVSGDAPEEPNAGLSKIIRVAEDQIFADNDPNNNERVRYSLTIANTTNEPLNGFRVEENLPEFISGVANVEVQSGGSDSDLTVENANSRTPTFNYSGTIPGRSEVVIWYQGTLISDLDAQVPAGESVNQTNTATVFIGDEEVNTSSTQFTVFDGENPPQDPDIILQKFVSTNPNANPNELTATVNANQGQNITYYFLVSNAGATPISEFTIDETTFPSVAVEDLSNIRVVAGTASDSQGFTQNGNSFTWTGTLNLAEFALVGADSTVKNDAPAGNATNVALASTPNEPQENQGNNESSTTLNVRDPGDEDGIIVQKEVLGANVAIKGETTEIDYRITVGNAGDEAISPTVSEPIIITDTLPPIANGTITNLDSNFGETSLIGTTINWFGGTVPPNGEVILTYTVELDSTELENTPDGNIQTNFVTSTYQGQQGSDEAFFTVEGDRGGTDLTLQKTVDPEDVSVAVGQTVNYQFRITNTRTDDFNGTLTIDESQWPSDILSDIETVSPPNAQLSGNTITWTGTIPAQDFIDITATATAENVGVATNIAVVTTDGDENPDNNEDDTTVVVTDEPEPEGLAIQKTVLSDSSIEPGSDTRVEYEITVGNDTNENITEFTIIEETWPDVFASIDSSTVSASRGTATLADNGVDIDWSGSESDFTPGDNVEITFVGIIRNDLAEADRGVQKNVASVTFDGETRRDDAEFTITPPGGNPNPDLAIQKEVDNNDIIVDFGETVNYTFTITNNSSQEFIGSFRIAEDWPSDILNDINSVNEEYGTAVLEGNDIVWQGSIAGGSQLEIQVTATAKDLEGQASNIATIRNPDGTPWEDDNPENDQDQTTIVVRDDSDNDPIDGVEKILEGNLQSVAPGQQITFTARFTNNSQQTVSQVTIQENGTNFTIDSITANQGTISGNTPTFTWTGSGDNTIIPGESLVVTIVGTVADVVGETMFNEITFEDPRNPNDEPIDDPDPDDNNDITEPVPIESDPIDNVTKTVDGNPSSVRTGDTINFTATVTNRSGQTVTQYTITEQTTNFRIDSITAQSGSISGFGPTYTWTGSLPNNATLIINISGTVTGTPDGKGGGGVVNTIIFSNAIGEGGQTITDPDPSDTDSTTPAVPIIGDISVTPITGGAIALTTGLLGLASLAGAGFYFYRKRGGFKINT